MTSTPEANRIALNYSILLVVLGNVAPPSAVRGGGWLFPRAPSSDRLGLP
jgi:hypothetical protein